MKEQLEQIRKQLNFTSLRFHRLDDMVDSVGIPKEKLWVNPDCGLKTRNPEETVKSLENMVKAAENIRKEPV